MVGLLISRRVREGLSAGGAALAEGVAAGSDGVAATAMGAGAVELSARLPRRRRTRWSPLHRSNSLMSCLLISATRTSMVFTSKGPGLLLGSSATAISLRTADPCSAIQAFQVSWQMREHLPTLRRHQHVVLD